MRDEGHIQTNRILSEVEARVEKVYRQAAEETQKKFDHYVARFRAKDEVKRRMLLEGTITKQEYQQWQIWQVAIGKRWEEMRTVLAIDYHRSNVIARSIVRGYMPEVYALNHNYGTFLVEKGSKINTSYTLFDRQTVERLIREEPQLLPDPGEQMKKTFSKFEAYKRGITADLTDKEIKAFGKLLANNKDVRWQEGQIQSAVTQAILQGESIPHLSQRIANTMGEINRKSTTRYARTAITAAQNAGRVDSYKRAEAMGIDLEQEWLATLDKVTRDSHRKMDGETAKVGEEFSNGCEYPGDPDGPPEEIWNCRCTLVPHLKSIDQSLAPRHDEKLGGMSYDEWKHEHDTYTVQIPEKQLMIGTASTVSEINEYMNGQGWFGTGDVDLSGCDLESAKSIASAYEQVFAKYPKLMGQFDAPNAQPTGMSKNTYAWCYSRSTGKVQVNPTLFNNWNSVVSYYTRDVNNGFHPDGTTAESIVTHEIGHAIDGLLARKGVLGGYTSSGEFRFASSSMKTTIMNRAAKKDSDLADMLAFDKQWKGSMAISEYVSKYATENPREWFAECFAEYITSADPRLVASEFGEELERLVDKL